MVLHQKRKANADGRIKGAPQSILTRQLNNAVNLHEFWRSRRRKFFLCKKAMASLVCHGDDLSEMQRGQQRYR